MCYRAEGVPQFDFACTDYGMGNARDSAVKGTALLGVKAVFAQTFERIHRTNPVCLGVLPCQFVEGRGLEFLNLTGGETFDLRRIDGNVAPQQQFPREATVRAPNSAKSVENFYTCRTAAIHRAHNSMIQ